MADAVLGVVASGLAVASLAIQLVDVAQKFHVFWQTFQGSDSNIQRIKINLEILQAIAKAVAEVCKEQPTIDCGKQVVKSLEVCKARIGKLCKQVIELQLSKHKASSSRKYWLALKVTVRSKSIEDIERQLQGDVMMLILALQPFFHRIQHRDMISLATSLKQVSSRDEYESEVGTPTITNLAKPKQINVSRKEFGISSTRGLVRRGAAGLGHATGYSVSFKLDWYQVFKKVMLSFGIRVSPIWRQYLNAAMIDLDYKDYTQELVLDCDNGRLFNSKRRLKVILPRFAYQFQTSSLPRSLTWYPLTPCQSSIFKLCADGNFEIVRCLFENSSVSPFVVNQHGENLLHAAATYAHADLCIFLLEIGVDGSAYDDRLLTPLDHLARRVNMNFKFPNRVVNTIRALVEQGRCQPILPLTSNAVAFYRGPEEGFAWLFNSEYAGVDLELADSESWTLLGDAAFNFGWWSQLCVDEEALCWQSLYLLRAGVDPNAPSAVGRLTPLDAYLRGCSHNQIDGARKWLAVLSRAGMNLHEYALCEEEYHNHQHFMTSTWDEELWKWIPTKRRVVYEYGESSDRLAIWLEDYDALSWFHCGRYDLDIFEVCTQEESLIHWKNINEPDDHAEASLKEVLANEAKTLPTINSPSNWHMWIKVLVISLCLHYSFHLFLKGA